MAQNIWKVQNHTGDNQHMETSIKNYELGVNNMNYIAITGIINGAQLWNSYFGVLSSEAQTLANRIKIKYKNSGANEYNGDVGYAKNYSTSHTV